MMWYSHLAWSLFFGLIFLGFVDVVYPWIFLLVVLVASLVPDIDCYKSKVGRKLPIISHLINFIFGHRGLFHSLLIPFIVLVLAYAFGIVYFGWAFFVGFVGHLIADALTKEGVNFFYPLKLKISGFVKTNGWTEKLLLLVVVVLNVFLILGML